MPDLTTLSRRRRIPPLFFALCLLHGCANLIEPGQEKADVGAKCDCPKAANAEISQKDLDTKQQRKMLNEGYSLLHQDATKLNLTELLLYIKSESDALKAIVKEISAYAGTVEKNLERIARDYPAVEIDLDPLPVMEKRKRWNVGKGRAIDFAPAVGRGGREYERTLLISFQNGINHQRNLCKVMAEEEPVESLQEFLADTERGYDELYRRIDALLIREYFVK